MAQQHQSHRSALILNMIAHLGPISRTELVALTDYRPATVGAIVGALLEEGLILETGCRSAGHGRNRIMLELNHAHLCAMGISFSQGAVHYIVAQPDGTILHRSDIPIPPEGGREALTATVTARAEQLLAEFSQKNMIGIGICNPLHDPHSYHRPDSLYANYHHFNHWIRDQLLPRLEACAGCMVRAFSSVTLPVIAEQRFGVARGAENFLWVELSNGIGASICCNGTAVGGAGGVAGELGHTVLRRDGAGPLCYCGKPGCVESTAAYPALLASVQKALESGVFSVLSARHRAPADITLQDLRAALDDGDRMCLHLVRESARQLGTAIANAVNLLNPELVILYGFMLELGEHFLQPLEAAIRENVISLASDFEIRLSESLESILPLGAVAELFSEYFQSENYKWVYRLRAER